MRACSGMLAFNLLLPAGSMAELTWEGKYDARGARTAPLRVALPFQTVETINETAQDRQRSLDLFGGGETPSGWRNRLIWGDKKYVLPALADEFAGQVDLIYIDPPFFTGDNFSFRVYMDGTGFEKEPNVIEQKAYRDTWGKGTDGYLQWFYETAVLLHTLLADTGSIVVHLDWHIGHYAKTVLDEVFGIDQFRNEIAWCYGGGGAPTNYYHRKHDTLFWYSKGTTSNAKSHPSTSMLLVLGADVPVPMARRNSKARRWRAAWRNTSRSRRSPKRCADSH